MVTFYQVGNVYTLHLFGFEQAQIDECIDWLKDCMGGLPTKEGHVIWIPSRHTELVAKIGKKYLPIVCESPSDKLVELAFGFDPEEDESQDWDWDSLTDCDREILKALHSDKLSDTVAHKLSQAY